MKFTRVLTVVIFGLIALVPVRAIAAPITASYGLGALSGTVTFDVSGSNLVVTLTNTSLADPTTSADILTGIFFNVAGDPALQGGTADICGGCSISAEGALGIPPDTQSVAGEWAFRHKAGFAYGTNYGISAVSAGSKFTDTYLFGGPNSNQSGEAGPAGVDYGITTAKDSPTNDKSSIAEVPLISNQVIFTLTGLPGAFNINAIDAISHIQFQYGTASKEAPEPATVLLFGMGAAGAMFMRRRRKSVS